MPAKRLVALWTVLFLLVTGAAGYVVGELAQPGSTWFANITERGQFAWQPASVAAAAVAAVLLAAFTAALAAATSRNVAATVALAESARADVPVVVVETLELGRVEGGGGDGGRRVSVAWAVRNIGSGPAVGLDVHIEHTGEHAVEPEPCRHVAATLSPADPDFSGVCTFRLPDGGDADLTSEDFRLVGDYLDRRMASRTPVIDPRRT